MRGLTCPVYPAGGAFRPSCSATSDEVAMLRLGDPLQGTETTFVGNDWSWKALGHLGSIFPGDPGNAGKIQKQWKNEARPKYTKNRSKPWNLDPPARQIGKGHGTSTLERPEYRKQCTKNSRKIAKAEVLAAENVFSTWSKTRPPRASSCTSLVLGFD